jgi:hypothetical protein
LQRDFPKFSGPLQQLKGLAIIEDVAKKAVENKKRKAEDPDGFSLTFTAKVSGAAHFSCSNNRRILFEKVDLTKLVC